MMMTSNTIDPNLLLREFCTILGVSTDDVRGRRRWQRLAECRHLACYFLHTKTGMSLAEVGAIIGGRDHTTILHSTRQAAKILDKQKFYFTLMEAAIRRASSKTPSRVALMANHKDVRKRPIRRKASRR